MPKKELYKYRILELINKEPREDYSRLKSFLADSCGVSMNTFRDWMYIKSNEGQEIRSTALLKISEYFEIKPIELFSEKPHCPTKKEFEETKTLP